MLYYDVLYLITLQTAEVPAASDFDFHSTGFLFSFHPVCRFSELFFIQRDSAIPLCDLSQE